MADFVRHVVLNQAEREELFAGYAGLHVPRAMFTATPRPPTDAEVDGLWSLFQQIGRIWDNVPRDSTLQRSSWLEFVRLRFTQTPSYREEYRNALRVLSELHRVAGSVRGPRYLLLEHAAPPPPDPPQPIPPEVTRLDHAKLYVVDEFIKVQIVAGGFRGFGSDDRGQNRENLRAHNYNGFVRGSRYNRTERVRAFRRDAGNS